MLRCCVAVIISLVSPARGVQDVLIMPVQIVRLEIPQAFQRAVTKRIFSAIGDRKGLWEVDVASELNANAWDVELFGPRNFHWARRFSGEDRDAEVIATAIHDAIDAAEKAA